MRPELSDNDFVGRPDSNPIKPGDVQSIKMDHGTGRRGQELHILCDEKIPVFPGWQLVLGLCKTVPRPPERLQEPP